MAECKPSATHEALFKHLLEMVGETNKSISHMEGILVGIEKSFISGIKRFEAIEKKLADHETSAETRIDKIEGNVADNTTKINFILWAFGLILMVAGAVIGKLLGLV